MESFKLHKSSGRFLKREAVQMNQSEEGRGKKYGPGR
jgi:hypothetical protein